MHTPMLHVCILVRFEKMTDRVKELEAGAAKAREEKERDLERIDMQ